MVTGTLVAGALVAGILAAGTLAACTLAAGTLEGGRGEEETGGTGETFFPSDSAVSLLLHFLSHCSTITLAAFNSAGVWVPMLRNEVMSLAFERQP